MKREALLELARQAGLARVSPALEGLMMESIRLKSRPLGEKSSAPGVSKLGGLPDLPVGTNWPAWKGIPLSFVAQLRLPDVSSYPVARSLPPSGMLYFFYDADQQAFGADPSDRDGWKVLYYAGDISHVKQAPALAALPSNSRFRACSLEFSLEITLPQQPALYLNGLDWTRDELDLYSDFLFKRVEDRTSARHRMLGHADEIQDDMHLQCQWVSHGVRSSRDPRSSELEKGAMDWQLLLQVDSDDNNYLHDQVCGGQMTLQEAQQRIATNWLAVYAGLPSK